MRISNKEQGISNDEVILGRRGFIDSGSPLEEDFEMLNVQFSMLNAQVNMEQTNTE